MDTTASFPKSETAWKAAHPSAEALAVSLNEERLRLQEDQDALREREENLREYESRLRSLQAEIEAERVHSVAPMPMVSHSTPSLFQRPSSRAPFTDEANLQVAWEKLHRAREILEAEQKNLRDDRITIREQEAMIKRREAVLTEREARLAERESLLLNPAPLAIEAVDEVMPESAVSRLSRMPFQMARSVFGGRKAS
jgi:DNA repair exonuclease SbcCD ATPase subunit